MADHPTMARRPAFSPKRPVAARMKKKKKRIFDAAIFTSVRDQEVENPLKESGFKTIKTGLHTSRFKDEKARKK